MLAQTRLKLKNAETSLAFIQKQHAKTLEGLHKEIEQLQKKNARLTFDLAMIAPPGSMDSSECAGCQRLEDELISSKAEVLRLSSTLSSEKDNSALLQHQVQELEAKYTTELSSKEEHLENLTAELEKKSNTIALLTQQFHQLRATLHQAVPNVCAQDNEEAASAIHDTSDVARAQYQFRGLRLTPNPPSGISRRTPATIQRRNFRRTTSSPVPCEVSSMTSIDGMGSKRALPTPPISPKPLSYSSSPPAMRRARKPLRRQTPNSSTVTLSECSRQQSTDRGSTDRPRATTPLEPVRRQKSGLIPAEISDIIQSNRSSSQEQVSMKQPPPVLPPIESSDYLDTLPLSGSTNQSTPPRRHRHFILSKAQGLSSAPVVRRPMRMTCYSHAKLDGVEAAKVEEGVTQDVVMRVNETEDSTWTELHQRGTDH